MITELKPRFNHPKSFYGKALVITEENKIILQSYNTLICEYQIDTGNIVFYDCPSGLHSYEFNSPTTNRHVWTFLLQIEETYNLKMRELYWVIMELNKIKSFKQFRILVKMFNPKTGNYILRGYDD